MLAVKPEKGVHLSQDVHISPQIFLNTNCTKVQSQLHITFSTTGFFMTEDSLSASIGSRGRGGGGNSKVMHGGLLASLFCMIIISTSFRTLTLDCRYQNVSVLPGSKNLPEI